MEMITLGAADGFIFLAYHPFTPFKMGNLLCNVIFLFYKA